MTRLGISRKSPNRTLLGSCLGRVFLFLACRIRGLAARRAGSQARIFVARRSEV